jgi:hypothetical protein
MKSATANNMVRILLTFKVALGLATTPALAEDATASKAPAASEENENLIKPPPRTPAVKKVFTDEDRRKICARHEGRYIAYAGEVFKVEKCKRRPVHSSDLVFDLVRRGNTITEVDAKPIAALAEGPAIDPNTEDAKARSCNEFNGRYVSHSYGDVWFVERCTRRLIPDWETYLTHRRARGGIKNTDEILVVNWAEFNALREGRPVASVVDEEFSKYAAEWAPIDIIPIDEACAGVDGKYVSFYSRLYKIEKCRKREIDSEHFLWKNKTGQKFTELRPEQWISMPDGPPIKPDVDPAAKPQPFDPGAPKD